MKIIIFGATGGVGRELVVQALARGHEVTALARDPTALHTTHERLRVLQGSVLDGPTVEAAVAGHQAILCALGSRSLIRRDNICSAGTSCIVAAMSKHGIRRLVVCSSSGVGDSRTNIPWIGRPIVAWVVADKEAQEQVVRLSDTDWTLVRPTGLRYAAPRGDVAVAVPGPLPTRQIARADVAAFMLDQLTSDVDVRQAPAISWRG